MVAAAAEPKLAKQMKLNLIPTRNFSLSQNHNSLYYPEGILVG